MDHALLYALCGLGAFALGALIGRYYVPDMRPLRRKAEQGQAYARALTAVLAHDQAAAIAELSSVAEGDVQQVEPYFALGCLFRERGEHERAVRTHQSVLLRRDVDARTLERARYELGLDFLAAGFPRHALKAFTDLTRESPQHVGALRALLKLHEEGGDHAESLAVHRRLRASEGHGPERALESHLLARLAAAEAAVGDLEAARRRLKEADSLDPGNLHVLATWAPLERARGNIRDAAKLWERALRAAPDLAPWIYPRLEEAFFEADRMGDLGELLEELLTRQPTVPLRLCHARFAARQSPREATAELRAVLAEAPALLAAREELGRLLVQYGTVDAIKAEYEALLAALKRLGRGYRCAQCGHAAADLFWQCPGCRAWDTVRLAWGRRAGEAPAAALPAATEPHLPAASATGEVATASTAEEAAEAPQADAAGAIVAADDGRPP
jgi:lipopolysaccharide biosynthesis regulator YciM